MIRCKLHTHSIALAGVFLLLCSASLATELKPASDRSGYIARLLINEAPFPGERGYVSEEDSKAAMAAILWVLHGRTFIIPSGYRQTELATVRAEDIITVITAGGVHGQVDGFYHNEEGRFVCVPRVDERIRNLQRIANTGTPGRFGRLLSFAQELADAYLAAGQLETVDRFEPLTQLGPVTVTGRAYAWMTDLDYYNPGGSYVRIPNTEDGSLGGNRFFTLETRQK